MKKRSIIAIFFVLALIVIDQFSKYLVRQNGGFYICNKGVAFGINIPELLFWPIWIGVFISLIFYLLKNKSEVYFFSLIIAGAFSNLLDRLFIGCIIDFINLKIWPLFNLADTFIVIGAIMIVVSKIKIKK